MKKIPKIKGYVRKDGRVGFRNYVVIVPLAGCVQGIANRIAAEVKGTVVLNQPLGCDLLGPDSERLNRILYQLANHPNVGGALFVTLGCAAVNIFKLPQRTSETGRLAELLNFQLVGGTSTCVRAGVKTAKKMVKELVRQKKSPVPVSSIILGTKCGASDQTSFQVCHLIVGAACDRLVDMGATVVLSEDYELYAAIEELVSRSADSVTAQKLREMAGRLAVNLEKRTGMNIDGFLGDKEKARQSSLGHMAKAGTKPVNGVVRLGEEIDTKGLVVLDGPNSDLISVTSLSAVGCNLLAFTTGRGTPVASPIVPTIKVTANEKTYKHLEENTDILVTKDDLTSADRLIRAIFDYANGLPTKAEKLGHGEMFVPLEGVTF